LQRQEHHAATDISRNHSYKRHSDVNPIPSHRLFD
jgi:hypothetical protein